MASESSNQPTTSPDQTVTNTTTTKFAPDENPVEIVVTEPSMKVRDVLLDSMDRWNLGLGKILSVNINNAGNDSPTSVDSGFNTSSPASNKGDSSRDSTQTGNNTPSTSGMSSTSSSDHPPIDDTTSLINGDQPQEDVDKAELPNYIEDDAATLVSETTTVAELSMAFAELAPPTVKTTSPEDKPAVIEPEASNPTLSDIIEKVVRDNRWSAVQSDGNSGEIPITPMSHNTGNPVPKGIFKEPASRAKKRSDIPRVGKKAEKNSELQKIMKQYEPEISLLIRKQQDDKLMMALERREKTIRKMRSSKKSLLSGKPPTLPSCPFTSYRIIYLLLKYHYPLEMIDEIITERWFARVTFLKKNSTFRGPNNPRSKVWPPAYTTSRAERDAKERAERKEKLQAAIKVNAAISEVVSTDTPEPAKIEAPSDMSRSSMEGNGEGQVVKIDAGIVEQVDTVKTSKPKRGKQKRKQTRGRKKVVLVSESGSEGNTMSEGEQDNGSDEDFDIRKAVKEMTPTHQKSKPIRKSRAARTVFITEDSDEQGPSEPPVLRASKRASVPLEEEIPKQRRSTRLKDNPICFKDVSDAEFRQMLKIAGETETTTVETEAKTIEIEATPIEAEAKTVEMEAKIVKAEAKTVETKAKVENEEIIEAKESVDTKEVVQALEEMQALDIADTKEEEVEKSSTVAVVRGGRGRPRRAAEEAPVLIGRVMFDETPNPLANQRKRYVEAPVGARNAGGFNNFRTEYSRRVSDQSIDSLLAKVWTPTETKRINIKNHFTSPNIRRAYFNTSCYCYAIATLQMLYRAPQVYSIISSHLHKEVKTESEEAPKNCLMCSLASTISVRPDMDCPDFEVLFSKVWPSATAFEMQCVMEAMQKFFLRLDTEYMRDHPAYYKMRPEKFSPFRTFFEIEYIIHHKCTDCQHTETLRDRSIYLTVNAEKRNSGTMQDLISKMTIPEHMNGLHCPACRQPSVKVHYTFTKLPEVLLYFIPRVKDGKLLETFVPAQKHLTMKARTKAPQTYTLSSFIVHIGDTTKAGHYVLYEVNESEDGYNRFDDEKVMINARLGCNYRMVIAMYRKNEDVAKDVPVDMIFDGRGNIMYADEKHCHPKRH